MSSLQKLNTVLFEVQQACTHLSLPVPTGVYNLTDETALAMGAHANTAGVLISEAHDWEQLRLPYTITGDGVRTAWDLPQNFSRFVDNTGWSLGMRRPVAVLNAQQWYQVMAWLSHTFYAQPACRILADQLAFLVAPANGEQIIFEYVDSNWVIDQDNVMTLKQIANKNGDQPRFDWLLMALAIKTKWLEGKGMDTTASQADFNDRLLQLTQHDKLGQVLTLSGPYPTGYRYLDNYYNTPPSFFGT